MSVTIRCEVEDIKSFFQDQKDQSERIGSLEARVNRAYEVEDELRETKNELRIARQEIANGPKPLPGTVSVRALQELMRAQKNGEKISMIKVVRELTGQGLKEAKDTVEEVVGSIMARPNIAG